MALLDMVQGNLDQSAINQISNQLGVPPGLAQTAIAAAVPMIVAGMARHASNPAGAQAMQQAAERHQNTLDNVGGALQVDAPADTGSLPGSILGEHHEAVTQGVQQATGLDRQKVGRLVMMLSPIVLGALARKQFGGKAQGASTQAAPQSGDIGATLRQEGAAAEQHIQRQMPQLGGLLGKLFKQQPNTPGA